MFDEKKVREFGDKIIVKLQQLSEMRQTLETQLSDVRGNRIYFGNGAPRDSMLAAEIRITDVVDSLEVLERQYRAVLASTWSVIN